MSSRTYHYREAEKILAEILGFEATDRIAACAALAQVHATLATAPEEVEAEARQIECRAAERAEALEEGPPFRQGDPIEYVTHAAGLNARNGEWVPGTFLDYGRDGRACVRSLTGGPGQRILSKVTEIRRRT